MKAPPPRWILGGGWLVFLLTTFPGFLRADSADQLVDSRVGEFTDWHSPMLTLVWRIVGVVVSGPAGMLVLQSLLLVGGAYHLLRRVMSPMAAAWTTVGLLLFPPVLATSAVICAEAQVASFLLAGTAALLADRRGVRIAGLVLMIIACGMRAGVAIAALPLILATFRWGADERRWRRVGIALAAWLAVALLAAGTVRLVVDHRSERKELALAMFDIIGTLRFATDVDDAQALRDLEGVHLATQTGIQHTAQQLDGKPSRAAAGEGRLFEPPQTDDERDALFAARRSLAMHEPGSYLHHRLRHLFRLLGLKRPPSWTPAYTKIIPTRSHVEPLQHAERHSLLQSLLLAPVQWTSKTLLFRPVIFFVLALLLLPFALLRRQHIAAVLIVSAITHELALSIVTTTAGYTDSHWMIVATLVAAALLIAHWTRRDPQRGLRGDGR